MGETPRNSRHVMFRTAILACALFVTSAAVWAGVSALNLRTGTRDAPRHEVAGASESPAQARAPDVTGGPGDAGTAEQLRRREEEYERRREELRRRLDELRPRADETDVRLRDREFRWRNPDRGCLIGSSRFGAGTDG